MTCRSCLPVAVGFCWVKNTFTGGCNCPTDGNYPNEQQVLFLNHDINPPRDARSVFCTNYRMATAVGVFTVESGEIRANLSAVATVRIIGAADFGTPSFRSHGPSSPVFLLYAVPSDLERLSSNPAVMNGPSSATTEVSFRCPDFPVTRVVYFDPNGTSSTDPYFTRRLVPPIRVVCGSQGKKLITFVFSKRFVCSHHCDAAILG